MNSAGGAAPRGGTGFREGVRATALYVGLLLVMAYPLPLHPASMTLPGDPDTDLFMWTLAWNTHALVQQPLSVFDANIYYPHRNTLAFSENLIGSTIFAAPVLWLTGSHVLALNTVSFFSVILCGLGAWLLARRLGALGPAAVLAGLVFAYSPARFLRFGQLHLTTIQWIPFSLAFLHAYLDGGRKRDLRLAVGFFTLQVFTSGHGATFLTVAIVCFVVFRLALGEPLAVRRRIHDLGISGLLLLLAAVVILPAYHDVQVSHGLRRTLLNWAPSVESFFASPSIFHLWLLSKLPDAEIVERASAWLFPGFLPLLLAAAALVSGSGGQSRVTQRTPAPEYSDPREGPAAERPGRTGREEWRRNPVLFYGLLLLLCVLLAAGPPIGLWPLVYHLPGFNFIRVPSRFVLLGTLALAVLAAFGFQSLTARLGPRRRVVAAIVVGALMLAEFLTIPLPGIRPTRVEIPAVDRWLDTQPKPFVVAEVPTTTYERLQSIYMLHSMAHWQRTVNGHSGLRTPFHIDLFDRLTAFPEPDVLRRLAAIGVTFVVVHPRLYSREEWATVEPALAQQSDWLELVREEDGDRVYRLRPQAAPGD